MGADNGTERSQGHAIFPAGRCSFLADFQMKMRLFDMGIEPTPMTAAEFGKFIAAETAKWAKVVKFAGIKAE